MLSGAVKISTRTYGVTLAVVALALVARWVLDPILGDYWPFPTFVVAVAFSAWHGGLRTALLAMGLGFLLAWYFFIPPRFGFSIESPAYLSGLGMYVLVCLAVALFGEGMRAARRRAEVAADQLRNTLSSARLLASIVESSGDAIISKSLAGIIQSWNAAAERMFGYTAEEALGRHISLLIPADRNAEEDVIIASLKAGKRIEHYETVRLRSDGRPVCVSLTISPVRDESGQIIGASKIVRDITAQRRGEERERQLQADAATVNAKFQAFFDQGPSFAGVMALDGTLLEANRLALEACGYTKDEVIGKKFWDCPWWNRSPELQQTIRKGTESAAAGESFRAELPYYVADGSERIVDFVLQPIKDNAGRVLFLAPSGTDITDRKRAEADRQMFVTLIESSTDFIGICDLKGVPFFVNRAGLHMVGLDNIDEARRTPVRDFFFPEDQSKVLDEFFPSVAARGHGEIEIRFRHFKGGQARWMSYKVLSLTDGGGRPMAFATVSQDITERRTLEDNLRQVAASLSEAHRRKDEFLATLAHELRNPLAPMRSALQVIQLAGSDAAAIVPAREMMERQMRHMVRLVDDLLDVSRITRGKLDLRQQRVDLATIVRTAVETSRPLIETAGHELIIHTPPQPVFVNADPVRLAQVFANLLNNAAKYTDRGGKITLTTERQGSDAVVSVRDTGAGIPPEMLGQVFELFTQVDQTLEKAQGGLGIGLTLVRRLIELHGGSVEARSPGSGQGSEFVVRLPAVLVAPAREERTAAVPARQAIARRILVVDDNRDSAISLGLMLELMGNEVCTAHDGQAAVEAACEFRPDVVLMDIGLPKLNGYEAARRIREQPWGEAMVLIAVTGWGQDDDRRRSREAGFNFHMVKPVEPAALETLLAGLPAPK